MSTTVTVWFGRTWPAGSPRPLNHFRLYGGVHRMTYRERMQLRVFSGMDGVVINDDPSTQVMIGCWQDIDYRPRLIQDLVGRKGLDFLKLLKQFRFRSFYKTTPVRGRKKHTEVLIREVHIESAWQFTVVGDMGIEKLVLKALKKHLKKTPVKRKWVFGPGKDFP